MRTDMHQQAFPGEDISDRPEPEVAAAALLRLLSERPPSGRYRASDSRHRPSAAGGDPVNRAASRPPEARGLTRDGVRLLAATPDGLVHARFRDLPRFLAAGRPAGRQHLGHRGRGRPRRSAATAAPVTVHWSGPLDDGTWLVELQAGTRHGRVTDGGRRDGHPA